MTPGKEVRPLDILQSTVDSLLTGSVRKYIAEHSEVVQYMETTSKEEVKAQTHEDKKSVEEQLAAGTEAQITDDKPLDKPQAISTAVAEVAPKPMLGYFQSAKLYARSFLEDFAMTVLKVEYAQKYQETITNTLKSFSEKGEDVDGVDPDRKKYRKRLAECKSDISRVACWIKLQMLLVDTSKEVNTLEDCRTRLGHPFAEYDAHLNVVKNLLIWLRGGVCEVNPDAKDDDGLHPNLEPLSIALRYERDKVNGEYKRFASDIVSYLFTTMCNLRIDAARAIEPKLGYIRQVPLEQSNKLQTRLCKAIAAIEKSDKSYTNDAERKENMRAKLKELKTDLEEIYADILGVLPAALASRVSNNLFMDEVINALNGMIDGCEPTSKAKLGLTGI